MGKWVAAPKSPPFTLAGPRNTDHFREGRGASVGGQVRSPEEQGFLIPRTHLDVSSQCDPSGLALGLKSSCYQDEYDQGGE